MNITLTINVYAATIDDVTAYLREVARQINAGCISGHVDHNTHWDSDNLMKLEG